MMIRTPRIFLSALVVDACALFVGVLVLRWWRGIPGAEGQLACTLILVSFVIVIRLVGEHGAWLLLPPVLGIVWLCAVPASPVFLLVGALGRTRECVRLLHARRGTRNSARATRFEPVVAGDKGQ
jgi:hypothetical protein